MAEISRVALFGKLNPLAYRAIESGTVFCKLRGNPYVELVHWLHQILLAQDSDLQRIDQALRTRSRRAGPRYHAGAGQLAAWFDIDLRYLRAGRRSRRARLGIRLADVRRGSGSHRASAGRHAADTVICATRCLPSRASSNTSSSTSLTERFATLLDGSPEADLAAMAPGGGTPHDSAAATATRRQRRRSPRLARCRARPPGSAAPLHRRPDRAGAQRQARSDRRPRRRDSPGDRHPDAPPPEQPDPDRARPASAKLPSSKASRSASSRATCRRRCAMQCPHARRRLCCKPAPA